MAKQHTKTKSTTYKKQSRLSRYTIYYELK